MRWRSAMSGKRSQPRADSRYRKRERVSLVRRGFARVRAVADACASSPRRQRALALGERRLEPVDGGLRARLCVSASAALERPDARGLCARSLPARSTSALRAATSSASRSSATLRASSSSHASSRSRASARHVVAPQRRARRRRTARARAARAARRRPPPRSTRKYIGGAGCRGGVAVERDELPAPDARVSDHTADCASTRCAYHACCGKVRVEQRRELARGRARARGSDCAASAVLVVHGTVGRRDHEHAVGREHAPELARASRAAAQVLDGLERHDDVDARVGQAAAAVTEPATKRRFGCGVALAAHARSRRARRPRRRRFGRGRGEERSCRSLRRTRRRARACRRHERRGDRIAVPVLVEDRAAHFRQEALAGEGEAMRRLRGGRRQGADRAKPAARRAVNPLLYPLRSCHCDARDGSAQLEQHRLVVGDLRPGVDRRRLLTRERRPSLTKMKSQWSSGSPGSFFS